MSEKRAPKSDSVFYCCDTEVEKKDVEGLEKFLQEDPAIFVLNNLLMTVHFFRNFERDVEILRENWFKEISLEPHHKRCFYADSLFRLTGPNVKFIPRHGLNKDKISLLHPLRIFVSSDNVEAAYDPSSLGRIENNLRPQYQLSVQTCEGKKEKSGYISLTEFKTIQLENDRPKTVALLQSTNSTELNESNPSFMKRKSHFDQRNSRRLTQTEKFMVYQNKESILKTLEKRRSTRFVLTAVDDIIPPNGFYNYIKGEARIRARGMRGFRMNTALQTSHEIPRKCFQRQDVKRKSNSRREGLRKLDSEGCFMSRKILNSAAFKGYFCDLLIKKLAGSLGLDFNAVTESAILEESVTINQEGIENRIIPVIAIRDWRDHVEINKKSSNRVKGLEWPTVQMRQIMEILPCHAVPDGYSDHLEENLDYEKEWKLVFPKAEEYLLLHMMHAHIRCYFFALAVYKSFIEPEINEASIGPKHLLHLLFWRVHRNFTAWPENRPGETLINFLGILYKKLQNKYLPDFFITSRNLFANSLVKDLHRAQSIIKMILENPLPFVMRALRNVSVDASLYPTFDILQLQTILTEVDTPPTKPKKPKKKTEKKVRFEEDEEKEWTKKLIKQIEVEKKMEKQETSNRLSTDSINTQVILRLDSGDNKKFRRILEAFISHFVEMGIKSIENKCLPQSLLYLYEIQRLMELLVGKGVNKQDLQAMVEKIKKLIEKCNNLKWSTAQREGKKTELPKAKSNAGGSNQNKIPIQHDQPLDKNTISKDNKKLEEPIDIKTENPQEKIVDPLEDEFDTKL